MSRMTQIAYGNVTEQEIDAEVFLNLHFAEPTAAFGQTSIDEMCFVFGYVYPASKAILELDIVGDNCTTVPNP